MEKRCPTCNRRYVEEDLNYCLADGSFLLTASETSPPEAPPTIEITDAPTEVMPRGQFPTEVLPILPPATVPSYRRAPSPPGVFGSHLWLIAFIAFCVAAIIAVLLLALSWRYLAANTKPLASGQSVEGTAWEGVYESEKITIEFLSNGQLRYTSSLATMKGDTWSQKGDVVLFSVNGGYAIHEGTMKGNQIEIKASNKDNYRWSYTVTRIR